MSIVVGFASGPLAELAIDRAVAEAELRGQPLVLAGHVTMSRSEQDATAYQRRRSEVEGELADKAEELSARGIRCIPFVPSIPTNATDAVLRAAEEHDADLIVVGMRRRSPVGKAVLGSSSQDILLQADCPVLGVKLPEDVEDAL